MLAKPKPNTNWVSQRLKAGQENSVPHVNKHMGNCRKSKTCRINAAEDDGTLGHRMHTQNKNIDCNVMVVVISNSERPLSGSHFPRPNAGGFSYARLRATRTDRTPTSRQHPLETFVGCPRQRIGSPGGCHHSPSGEFYTFDFRNPQPDPQPSSSKASTRGVGDSLEQRGLSRARLLTLQKQSLLPKEPVPH
jgi:hypothetical protein